MGDLWGTLITLAVGALLTVAGGLVGAGYQSRREHVKWVRERRFETYVEFVAYVDKISEFADVYMARTVGKDARKSPVPDEVREEMKNHQQRRAEVYAPLSILGPKEVMDTANTFLNLLSKSVNETPDRKAVEAARSAHLTAMRKVLDIQV